MASDTTDIPRVVHQLRRAHRLADAVASVYPQPSWALNAAEHLLPDGWVTAARIAGITPPSDDTIALTIELLRERTQT